MLQSGASIMVVALLGALLLLQLLVANGQGAVGETYPPPPPCITNSDEFGYVNGSISSTQTYYNCLANIPDATMLPTYYNNRINGPVTFSTAMTLNNLIQVDELEGTATISFSLGLSWFDERFSMPAFWKAIGGKAITVTTALTNDSVLMFQPQLRFADGMEVEITNQELTLSAANMFVWKGAVVCKVVQSGFQFDKYPGDTQDIVIRFYVYPFDNRTAVMTIFGDGVSFSTDENNEATFPQNPLWTYKSAAASTYLSQGSSSATSYALFNITVKRQGSGIILRLVVPVLLLLILSTLTFWTVYEERVNITITLLLSVSALYIVILGNIPLVGYLTSLDKYIFWMYLLLVIVVILHQVYATTHNKLDRWPLRVFYLRLVECIGRTCLLPAIVLYYLNEIPKEETSSSADAVVSVVLAASVVIFVREVFGLRSAWTGALRGLLHKINSEETVVKDLSWVELLVVNAWKFGVLSTSPHLVGRLLQKQERLEEDFVKDVKLRNLGQISDLTASKPPTRTSNWGIAGIRLRKRASDVDAVVQGRTLQMKTFASSPAGADQEQAQAAVPVFTLDVSQGAARSEAAVRIQNASGKDLERATPAPFRAEVSLDSDDER